MDGDTDNTRVTQVALARQWMWRRGTATDWAGMLAELAALRRSRMHEAALGVATLTSEGGLARLAFNVVFAGDGAAPLATVVGRHDATTVKVPNASLRHALVIAWPEGSPAPGLEIIDLNSTAGLAVGNSEPVRRLTAARQARLSVGSADVLAAYAPAGEAWPDPAVAAPVASLSVPPREDELAPQPPPRHFIDETAGRLLQLGARFKPAQEVELPAAVFERGVLVGRNPRCTVFKPFGNAGGVSRVHALALLRHGELWLADTASTNGSTVVNPGGEVVNLPGTARMARLLPGHVVNIAGERLCFRVAFED